MWWRLGLIVCLIQNHCVILILWNKMYFIAHSLQYKNCSIAADFDICISRFSELNARREKCEMIRYKDKRRKHTFYMSPHMNYMYVSLTGPCFCMGLYLLNVVGYPTKTCQIQTTPYHQAFWNNPPTAMWVSPQLLR